jgi:hypothetical protein
MEWVSSPIINFVNTYLDFQEREKFPVSLKKKGYQRGRNGRSRNKSRDESGISNL